MFFGDAGAGQTPTVDERFNSNRGRWKNVITRVDIESKRLPSEILKWHDHEANGMVAVMTNLKKVTLFKGI